MIEPTDHLQRVAAIVQRLRGLGFEPVLVGGMALVVLGSRRVTRDFDFLIADPRSRLDALVEIFYEHGLELASRLNAEGDVTATIDNRRVAALRLRLDAPASAYFFSAETGLRIDLLFDYPFPAADIAKQAERLTIRGQALLVASEEDLLRLKKAAALARSSPGDAEDIAFLEARQSNRSSGEDDR
jgi:hypothetical protein